MTECVFERGFQKLTIEDDDGREVGGISRIDNQAHMVG